MPDPGSRNGPLAAATAVVILSFLLPGCTTLLSAQTLRLVDDARSFGCREVSGDYVVLLKAGLGIVTLSTKELAGGEPLGSWTGSELRYSLPGLRMPEIVFTTETSAAESRPIYVRFDRGADVEGRLGCIGVEGDAVDVLGVAESERTAVGLFLALPEDALGGEALELAGSEAVIEISGGGRSPASMVVEAERITFDAGEETVLGVLLLPGQRAAVIASRPDGGRSFAVGPLGTPLDLEGFARPWVVKVSTRGQPPVQR